MTADEKLEALLGAHEAPRHDRRFEAEIIQRISARIALWRMLELCLLALATAVLLWSLTPFIQGFSNAAAAASPGVISGVLAAIGAITFIRLSRRFSAG